MATVTMQDGSSLELSAEEFVLYLQATGQVAQPKTDAERIAERMIELRNMDVENMPMPKLRELMGEYTALEKVQVEACPVITPEEKAQVNGHHPKRQIPMTKREMTVMTLLKEAYPEPLTTAEIAEILGFPNERTRMSGILSHLFQTGRGLRKGPHHTWVLESWANRSAWVLDGSPSRRWPPTEGDSST